MCQGKESDVQPRCSVRASDLTDRQDDCIYADRAALMQWIRDLNQHSVSRFRENQKSCWNGEILLDSLAKHSPEIH